MQFKKQKTFKNGAKKKKENQTDTENEYDNENEVSEEEEEEDEEEEETSYDEHGGESSDGNAEEISQPSKSVKRKYVQKNKNVNEKKKTENSKKQKIVIEKDVDTNAKKRKMSKIRDSTKPVNKQLKKQQKSEKPTFRELNHQSPRIVEEVHDSMETDENSKNSDDDKEKREGKKTEKRYNDKNVDYNLYNEAPENIVETKVKLNSTCMLMCKMIEANGEAKGLTYDMAALVIARKLKNGGIFEFTLPLNLAPHIMTGIDLIMSKNSQFFDRKPISSTYLHSK